MKNKDYVPDMLYLFIFDGLDLVSKEIIENNFNDKKEIKANIWAEAFRDTVPLSKLNNIKRDQRSWEVSTDSHPAHN